jgi:hypothetical protein
MLLLFADLDGLKWINDTFGHEEGDKALAEAAAVLRESFRTSDIVARLGGDEFAALAVDTTEADARIITARLQALIDAKNRRENRKFDLSISVGCSCYDLPVLHHRRAHRLGRQGDVRAEAVPEVPAPGRGIGCRRQPVAFNGSPLAFPSATSGICKKGDRIRPFAPSDAARSRFRTAGSMPPPRIRTAVVGHVGSFRYDHA